MRRGEPAVYAERAGYDKLWHPACFVCCTCKELLVDMIYFWKKGKLYCGRHYGDSEKPRCAGCDEVRPVWNHFFRGRKHFLNLLIQHARVLWCLQLIFCNEYTQAEGHNWHLKHFCCFDCDCILAGETYVMEKDKPVCTPCYMKSYAVVGVLPQSLLAGGLRLGREIFPTLMFFLTAEMLILQESSGPRGSEGLLRRPPLAR